MTIKTLTCVVIECDTPDCDPWGPDGFPHWASAEAAIKILAGQDWLFDGEKIYCPQCQTRRECETNGHQISEWFKACRCANQDACNHHENRMCDHCHGEFETRPAGVR